MSIFGKGTNLPKSCLYFVPLITKKAKKQSHREKKHYPSTLASVQHSRRETFPEVLHNFSPISGQRDNSFRKLDFQSFVKFKLESAMCQILC